MNKRLLLFIISIVPMQVFCQDGYSIVGSQAFRDAFIGSGINSSTCSALRYSTYAFPASETPYETSKGIVLSDNQQTFYSINGLMSILTTGELSISIDSVQKAIYLGYGQEGVTGQMDSDRFKELTHDTLMINRFIIGSESNKTTFRIEFKSGMPHEYVQVEVSNKALTKSIIQFPWTNHSGSSRQNETYHPKLVIEFEKLKNCGAFSNRLELSHYLTSAGNGNYAVSEIYRGFELIDFRYRQP